jgi:hypothetical protein
MCVCVCVCVCVLCLCVCVFVTNCKEVLQTKVNAKKKHDYKGIICVYMCACVVCLCVCVYCLFFLFLLVCLCASTIYIYVYMKLHLTHTHTHTHTGKMTQQADLIKTLRETTRQLLIKRKEFTVRAIEVEAGIRSEYRGHEKQVCVCVCVCLCVYLYAPFTLTHTHTHMCSTARPCPPRRSSKTP